MKKSLFKQIVSLAIYFKNYGTKKTAYRIFRYFKDLNLDQLELEESLIVKGIFNKLGKTGLMIDVGACHGATSLPFLKDGWNVYAFEPDSENRKTLINNLSPYTKKRVQIDDRAVSNKISDSVILYKSKESAGISGLSNFNTLHYPGEKINVTTLSKVIDYNKWGRIDFLKIDCEGFDKFVLEGLPWETHKPTVIVTEFENRKTLRLGYKFEDLADYLLGKGYFLIVSEWEPVVTYGQKHVWKCFKKYPCSLQKIHGEILLPPMIGIIFSYCKLNAIQSNQK